MTKADRLKIYGGILKFSCTCYYSICGTESKATSWNRGNARKCGEFEGNNCVKELSKVTVNEWLGQLKHLVLRQHYFNVKRDLSAWL